MRKGLRKFEPYHWVVEMVWFELAAPTQSYRTASLPPAWIAVISLWLRAACGRYLGPNVHRARRHEEDAAPSRHRSLSPNESAGRLCVMSPTAAGSIVASCSKGAEDLNRWTVANDWAVAYRKYSRALRR